MDASAASRRDAARQGNHGFLPRLAIRQRSSDHPVVMFAMVTGISLGAMAFASTSPVSFAEPQGEGGQTGAAPKQDRLRMKPKADACDEQAWRAEGSDCLVMIASAQPIGLGTNIF